MMNTAAKRLASSAARRASRTPSLLSSPAFRAPARPAGIPSTRLVSSSSTNSAQVSSLNMSDLQDALATIDQMPGVDLSLSSQGATEPGTRAIYMDGSATTPTDPRVLDAMMPYMVHQYGNPHSKSHSYGWETEEAVEGGRKVSGLPTRARPSLSRSHSGPRSPLASC